MIRQLYNYFLGPDKNLSRSLTKILGFMPKHLHFYKTAFTHRSQSTTQDDQAKYMFNNERLEYLGDAILDAVVAEYLFNKYPTQDEGFLTQMRSKVVNRKTLNSVADRMGLDVFLRLAGTTRISPTMMGNTLEAFVGAIYLDRGYAITRAFLVGVLKQYIDIHELESLNTNYKSQLLEYCQKVQKTVNYALLSHHRTRDHRERFKVAVQIDEENFSVAEDFSKKGAEQKASQQALLRLGVLKTSSDEEDVLR